MIQYYRCGNCEKVISVQDVSSEDDKMEAINIVCPDCGHSEFRPMPFAEVQDLGLDPD